MLARLSAHWPNLWDVLVKVMLGVMVLLMMAWRDETEQSQRAQSGNDHFWTSEMVFFAGLPSKMQEKLQQLAQLRNLALVTRLK